MASIYYCGREEFYAVAEDAHRRSWNVSTVWSLSPYRNLRKYGTNMTSLTNILKQALKSAVYYVVRDCTWKDTSRVVLNSSDLQTQACHFPSLYIPLDGITHPAEKDSPLTRHCKAPRTALPEDNIGKTSMQRPLYGRSVAPGHLPGDGTLAVVSLASKLLHFADSFCLDLI